MWNIGELLMIASNRQSNILIEYNHLNTIEDRRTKVTGFEKCTPDYSWQNMDLYLTSENNPSVGDYFLHSDDVYKLVDLVEGHACCVCKDINTGEVTLQYSLFVERKVIASTNPDLGLPGIPDQFLQEYVFGQSMYKRIWKVYVCFEKLLPKVINDFILIKDWKDSYSREDVLNVLNMALAAKVIELKVTDLELNDWLYYNI